MVLKKNNFIIGGQTNTNKMGKFHYNSSGYPVWNDSGKLVHRTIAKAKRGQEVHHKDENPHNFRRSNLQVMSPEAHRRLHARKRKSLFG